MANYGGYTGGGPIGQQVADIVNARKADLAKSQNEIEGNLTETDASNKVEEVKEAVKKGTTAAPTPSTTPTKKDPAAASAVNTNTANDNVVFDAFAVYGLKMSDGGNDVHDGFLPIYIKDADMVDNTDINHRIKVDIKLPWNAEQDITDHMSVSYSRKFTTGNVPAFETFMVGGGTLALEAFKKAVGSNLGGSILALLIDYFGIKYDASSLQKNLNLSFILPITKEVSIEEVRKGLNGLQGLLYPRAYGFINPPLLKVSIGGMYVGFKAFLKDVSYRETNFVTVNGTKFPMIIHGDLTFTNIFLYTWNSDADFGISNEFNLSKNPTILFGNDTPVTSGNGGGTGNSGSSTLIPGGKPGASTSDSDFVNSITESAAEATNMPVINTSAMTANKTALSAFDNYGSEDLMSAANIDYVFANDTGELVKNVGDSYRFGSYDVFNSGCESASLIDNIGGLLSSFTPQTMLSAYTVLQTEGPFGNILAANGLLSSGNVITSKDTDIVTSMYQITASIAANSCALTASVPSTTNVMNLFSDTNLLSDTINNLDVNSEDALSTLFTVTEAIALGNGQICNIVSDMTGTINTIQSTSPTLTGVTETIASATVYYSELEALAKMDDIKQFTSALYDKAALLYQNGKLDSNMFSMFTEMKNTSNAIDTTTVSVYKDYLASSLGSVYDTLSSV